MNNYFEYPELVTGLVAPVGVNLSDIEKVLTDYLNQYAYKTDIISLSSLIRTIQGLETELIETPEAKRIDSYMTAGDEARANAKRGDLLAALGICKIYQQRTEGHPLEGTAHIFNSLKHPEEIQLLRKVYNNGFFLLSVTSSRSKRLAYLTDRKGIPSTEANRLIARDESEELEFGQNTREAFHLADCFIDADTEDMNNQIKRFLSLVFGDPFETPTKDEYAMYLAFASALRSGDLSRQVGAVITSIQSEIISTGTNDVPCYGGGLYWEDNESDAQEKRHWPTTKLTKLLLPLPRRFSEG